MAIAAPPRPAPRRTFPGAPPGSGGSRLKIRPKDFGRADLGLLAASLVSSFAVVWIVFSQLTLLSGPLGFLLCWMGAFLTVYWAVNAQVFGRPLAADRVVGALVTACVLTMLTPLVLLIAFVFAKGWSLLSFHVLVATQATAGPLSPPGTAGVLHAIVGTLEQVALAGALGVPAAVLTAIFINEVGGRFTRGVRVIVIAMSGVPSIVAGVFIYSLWIVTLGNGFSGFAGALALAVLLLPIVTRGTEEVLKVVPNELREASTAMGAPEWRTTWSVVLPTARPGLITAVVMGIALAVGETAPLIVTIFGSRALNLNPFHAPQEALPLLAYTQVKLPRTAEIDLGYTAALVLFIVVFLLFILARVLGSGLIQKGLRSRSSKGMEEAASRGEMSEYQVMADAAARGVAGEYPVPTQEHHEW